MHVIGTEKLPIKMWLSTIEDEALQQAKNLANLPFVFKHVAIMPDAHCGYGMPIGGVIATKEVVIPNAVGVDIGCGMLATKSSLIEITKEQLKQLMGEIRKVIPVGFTHHKEMQDLSLMPLIKDGSYTLDATKVIKSEWDNARTQIGTLGGGNHFIEIQKDTDGFVWFMIHSGSRNLGFKVANYYNKIAKVLNERWFSQVPSNWQLAFLPLDSDEGQTYLTEMNYCVTFALANRELMAKRIKEEFIKVFPNIQFKPTINIAHNYASMENHFGQNVMVHRKGATLVRDGVTGIIPGSQGTSSYIVKGFGNPESFMSCSHGAGRKMSRTKAKEVLNLEDEIQKMEAKGIVHGMRNIADLDEASGAYKDIDEVMENQKDLVKILIRLSPIAVIKGD